jgi:hypothetical protein
VAILIWILFKQEKEIGIASAQFDSRKICHCNDSSFHTTKGVIQAMKKKEPVSWIPRKNPNDKKKHTLTSFLVLRDAAS